MAGARPRFRLDVSDEGSAATLELPYWGDRAAEPLRRVRLADALPGIRGPEIVLGYDADGELRRMEIRCDEGATGFRLTQSDDGGAAFLHLRDRSSKRPHLVFVDYFLPEHRGPELIFEYEPNGPLRGIEILCREWGPVSEKDDPIVRRLGDRVVRVDDESLWAALTSAFPFAAGRPEWSKVPGAQLRAASPERAAGASLGPRSLDTRRDVEEVKTFFERCVSGTETRPDDWVVYFGDNSVWDYRVELEAVGELLDEMDEIPENKYVFPPDASWCFMWSFEDDLYFGRCPTGRRSPAG